MRNILLPPLIAAFYWLWSHTWRFKVLEHPEFLAALKNGPVAFAHWHGDEMVVLRMGRTYHCAAMTSTSKDGELMTRILRFFGFGISRGSSTRGGARALVGMIRLVNDGFNATVAVDGPKGPRHKVKPGIIYLANHSKIPIIPTGVARQSAFVFSRSWNKTYLPWPFSRVIVSFGAPLNVDENLTEDRLNELTSKIEEHLHLERGVAQLTLIAKSKSLSLGGSSHENS